MRSLVACAVLCLAAAGAAGDEPPSDPDSPRSTITEWPPKPKPQPPANPPPKPNPPNTANNPNSNTPNNGNNTNQPNNPNPQNPNPPGQNAPNPQTAPNGNNSANPQNPAKPQTPNNGQNQTGQPQKTPAPAPLVGGSPFREIAVPNGQDINSVNVAGAVNSNTPGLGEKIVEIKITDNTKTGSVTVEYISGAKLGEILTSELVEQVRTNLNSCGLFKDIRVYWESNAVTREGSGVRLVISAKDKMSWIVAPLFAYSSRNIGGGLAYAESNAFGKNKKFLAVAEYTTSEKFVFLAFLDPQIHDTRFYYRVDFLARRDNIVEYAAGHDNSPLLERATDVDTIGAGALFGVNFTRRFHIDLRLKIYYDRVNPSQCFNTTNQDGSGTPDVVARQGGFCLQPSSSGWDNTLTSSIGYDGRAKINGIQHGLALNATWQYGARWLGTRFDYHLISASGMYAWKFFKEHNLLLKAGFDVNVDAPFKQELETGGVNMRGFVYRQYRGDTDVHATLEYLLPLFTVYGFSLRLIGFYDTNLTWFRDLPSQDAGPLARFVVHGNGFRDYLPDTPSGLQRGSWHNGLGGGVRMFLSGVVLPLFGVDFAYGIESNAFQIYFSLGSTLD